MSSSSSSKDSGHISVDLGDPSVADVDKVIVDVKEQARDRARQLIGTMISDRYRIIDLIAMGGMGAVYLGEHVHMRKRIAVKILHPESEDQPEIVARFEREALVGAHVSHPAIARANDFGKLDDGSYFLILEYVDGQNLGEVIKEGAMPAPRVAKIARELADALGAAHELGIVHRDMKPRNVMLGPGFMPKLIDFGFAKVSMKKLNLVVAPEARPPSRLTGVGVVFGTINYLAPEAAHGMDAVDERADLYALGVMMYEMLAGKHPFDSTDPVEMFNHHRMTPPPSFAERAPDVVVPKELDAIVRKLLEKDPYSRYQKAGEVIEAIDALPFEIEPIGDMGMTGRFARTPTTPPVKPKAPEPAAEAPKVEVAAPPKAPPKLKTKGKTKTGGKGKAAAATKVEAAPKGGSINLGLAVIAILAVAAAAFFATR
jgi:eukaryotic-like serine/threonine-protein kinase